MFEDKTTDDIHKSILGNISDDYEKSIGYPTYDITRSLAIELATLYSNLNGYYNKIDVDNLTGDDLTKYVKQRKGIIRKPSNKAIGVLTVVGNGTINIGDLFETKSGIQFKTTQAVTITSSGTVTIEAVVAGASGNVGANSIIQIPVTIPGIVSINNVSATTGGYEEESDSDLRDRYYEALSQPPTSGNKYHYISWAKECVGVGDAKVFPLWNGNNTVKVVIIDSNKQPASTDLVSLVQNYIDPLDTNGNLQGNGSGVAPIGAYCTVTSATGLAININATIVKQTNYTAQEIQDNITVKITEYLKNIAFNQDYISFAQVGSLILATAGVQDYSNLTVNGGTSNITIGNEQVAIMGTVTVS